MRLKFVYNDTTRMTQDHPYRTSRRQWIKQAVGAGVCLPMAQPLFALSGLQAPLPQSELAGTYTLTPEDDQFLHEVETASFQYFWDQQNPKTGMVQDRCDVRGGLSGVVASIAATGFGLTALCIGEKRGFITRAAALERLFAALNFLWKKLPNHRGFFYHWANINTGERVWDSEISSVDTAHSALRNPDLPRAFQPSRGQRNLRILIFNRVDWTWLSEDTSLLSHGWTPEIGFLPSRWDYYSELMMMYLLGWDRRPIR